jgi:hypothetical protein
VLRAASDDIAHALQAQTPPQLPTSTPALATPAAAQAASAQRVPWRSPPPRSALLPSRQAAPQQRSHLGVAVARASPDGTCGVPPAVPPQDEMRISHDEMWISHDEMGTDEALAAEMEEEIESRISPLLEWLVHSSGPVKSSQGYSSGPVKSSQADASGPYAADATKQPAGAARRGGDGASGGGGSACLVAAAQSGGGGEWEVPWRVVTYALPLLLRRAVHSAARAGARSSDIRAARALAAVRSACERQLAALSDQLADARAAAAASASA